MAPVTAQAHARSHSLLLLQKLLNLRDNASPLTLVLDTLEQSARPVIKEFIARAKISKTKIIFMSFTTLKKPVDADCFIRARQKSVEALCSEVTSHYPSGAPGHSHKVLVIIDHLNTLASSAPSSIAPLLSSLITPSVSLVATYHADVPLSSPPPGTAQRNEYEPHPLAVLSHLATAILRVSNLHQATERKAARDRSLVEPGFGLASAKSGVLIGLAPKDRALSPDQGGLVLEMEVRRRSGRSVAESFVLVPNNGGRDGMSGLSKVVLLKEHPLFRDPSDLGAEGRQEGDGAEEEAGTTFSLGLTDKQRRDREGVVLPYFDAQTDIGAGEGGRILYNMGREDDFDDEEDEI